ncbi:MAG TPA: heme ABC exporter ATP-binding protein CcmA [Paenirhodobacter sp.]
MLNVDDLTVIRGGIAVLSGLTFALAPGEVLALRGPNGVGKTTLLRTIAGLQPPRAGGISAAGLAYQAHADGLKAALTARENLQFWADIHGVADTGAALAQMGLGAEADRPVATLSAGQKRRLGLARLLMTGAALWLLDEPTVSLDAASVVLFNRMLGAHLTQGGAALIATHLDLEGEGRVLDLMPFRASAGDFCDDFDGAFG